MFRESEVRTYSRSFPDSFEKAEGALVYSEDGKKYIDFLSGCGSLNYGHNHPILRDALVSYVKSNGITMSLDIATKSKGEFIETFSETLLHPRKFSSYKFQFPGPTGTNAVEAAIKLARKVTGRFNIITFTNAFHGCSLGSLSLTGSQYHRNSCEPILTHAMRMPYEGYWGEGIDTSIQLEKMLLDPSSGYSMPAAIILETIQGEGGLNVASYEWMKSITEFAKKHSILIIIDDIQAGCGRSGSFFSFDALGIVPDIICLAKSISGFGLPMSLVLLKSEYDIWEPGEHNGTFRGNNLAFLTATEAIKYFWKDSSFVYGISTREEKINSFLKKIVGSFTDEVTPKGRGLMKGLSFNSSDSKVTKSIQNYCFQNGVIVELCGPHDEVLKLLPPLNIPLNELEQGLEIIEEAIKKTLIF